MKISNSIAFCLLGAGIAGSVQASVEGSVIVESNGAAVSEVRQFNSRGDLVPMQDRAQVLVPGFGGVPDLSHPQKVLVLLIGPNYQRRSLADLQTMFEGSGSKSLKNYYETQSGGKLRFGSFVYQSVPQPGYNGCSLDVGAQLARYSESSGDKVIDFDHVFYMGSFDYSKCPGGAGPAAAYGSLGTLEVSNQFGSYKHTSSWYSDQYQTSEFILNHEFGHQLGWLHSNLSSAQQHVEYGDYGEVMGSPFADYRISAFRKWSYGWMESARTLRDGEYGVPIEISRRTGPDLLMVPLSISRLKTQYIGRTMLAIAIEDEIPDQSGQPLPWRRTGLLPRIVSTGLPFSATSVLIDPNFDGTTQSQRDLVFDRPGIYPIPEAGVTVVVDRVSRSSAQVRIYDSQAPSLVGIHVLPNPSSLACYHRLFRLSGVPNGASVTTQMQNDGARELMKTLATGGDLNYSMFLGAGPLSLSASVMNADESYSVYNAVAGSAPNCTELTPVLNIEQTRMDGVYSRECGLIATQAYNFGSPTTQIYAGLGGMGWSFAGYGSWNLRGVDNRQIATTYWSDGSFPIGATTLAPVDCYDRPVPKLQLSVASLSADCKTVTFKVNQSAPGLAQSQISVSASVFGAGVGTYGNCGIDGEVAGSGSCTMIFDSSLHLKNFNVTASSPSDSTALQGTFICGASD
jgi:hypothetical protein